MNGYDTDELFERAKVIIKEEKIYFISDLAALLGIVPSTYYLHFPDKSERSNHLKDLMLANKVLLKYRLRNKWEDSEQINLQIALYKLVGTDEERKRLSQSYVDLTSKDKELRAPTMIDLTKLPEDVLEKIVKASEEEEDGTEPAD